MSSKSKLSHSAQRRGHRAAPAAEEVRGIFELQLYNPRSCRRLVERVRAAGEWEPALIVTEGSDGGVDSVVRPRYRSANSYAPSRRSPLRREFDRKIKSVIKPLVQRAWLTNLKRHDATHVVRYSPGDFYAAHCDVTPGDNYRYFTVLCYLNEDFRGGRTSFPLLNYSVEPRAGKAILFPSSYLHCAEPVVSGEKYVIVTWLTGPAPVEWI